MADIEDFIHEYLRRLDSKLDRVLERLENQAPRIGHLESNLAQFSVVFGQVNVQLADHSTRFDRLDLRLDRIEQKLEEAK